MIYRRRPELACAGSRHSGHWRWISLSRLTRGRPISIPCSRSAPARHCRFFAVAAEIDAKKLDLMPGEVLLCIVPVHKLETRSSVRVDRQQEAFRAV